MWNELISSPTSQTLIAAGARLRKKWARYVMIVAMQEAATEEQIQKVIEHLINMGFEVHRSTGERQTVLGAVGARREFDIRDIEVISGVGEVHRISSPYK